MLGLSLNVEKYLGGKDSPPDVLTLTTMFFFLNFLAATQDIAVDGWALTMLKRHNVGHASTCNSVGQTAGYFLESFYVHNMLYTRVSTVNRLTGYDGYRILTSPNQLRNFNHGLTGYENSDKFGFFSRILAYFHLISFFFGCPTYICF